MNTSKTEITNEPAETKHISMGKASTDRYLITLKTLKSANDLRNHMMLKMVPKTWIFVVKSLTKGYGWDIFISDEIGNTPSDKHCKEALKFAKSFLKKNK